MAVLLNNPAPWPEAGEGEVSKGNDLIIYLEPKLIIRMKIELYFLVWLQILQGMDDLHCELKFGRDCT